MYAHMYVPYLCVHVCVSHLVMSNSFQPMYCSLCNSLGKIIGVGSPSLLHESGIKPRSPALKADSLLSELPGTQTTEGQYGCHHPWSLI